MTEFRVVPDEDMFKIEMMRDGLGGPQWGNVRILSDGRIAPSVTTRTPTNQFSSEIEAQTAIDAHNALS